MSKILQTILLLCFFDSAAAQKLPFWDEIQAMAAHDSIAPPPTRGILFIGSSSFVKWTDVQASFPRHPLNNRAFGGSTLEDQIRYFQTVVKPCRPRQVVVYCGENDFAQDENLSVETVVARFEVLFSLIRKENRRTRMTFVSMKPSPARSHLMPKFEAANRQIEAFLKKKRRTHFIDIWPAMLGPDGRPRPELFGNDRLHMNAAGYEIWRRAIEPTLLKD